MSRQTIGLLVTLITLTAAVAWGDIIVLNGGERREGRVEEVRGTLDRIAFINSVGRVEMPRSRLEEIIEEPDAVDYAHIGKQYMESGSYTTAITWYQRSIEADPDYQPAREGLDRARELLASQQNEAEQQMVDENAQVLAGVRDMIDREEFERALSAIDQVVQTTKSDEQRATAEVLRRDLYLAWGLSSLDRLDKLNAETYLRKVLEIDPDNRQARDALLQIWENDPTKRELVLASYQQKLEENPDDLVLNMKVADLLYSSKQFEEAIDPLSKLIDSPRYRTLGYDQKLKTSMQNVANKRAASGDVVGAIEIYRNMIAQFPNTDPTPLKYLEYELQVSRLPEDDWEARARLLDDLEREGLHSLAVQEAEYILSRDPGNERAVQFLRDDALMRIEEIENYMRQGQYLVAQQAARNLIPEIGRFPDLTQRASDLYTKADIEARQQAQEIRKQAREIAQRGDEYFQTATRYAQLMKDQDVSDRTTVVSYKQEAIKYSSRAIQTYQVALQRDPSLGPVTGMDLSNKLADAEQLYRSLTAAPLPLPSRQMRGRVPQPVSPDGN